MVAYLHSDTTPAPVWQMPDGEGRSIICRTRKTFLASVRQLC